MYSRVHLRDDNRTLMTSATAASLGSSRLKFQPRGKLTNLFLFLFLEGLTKGIGESDSEIYGDWQRTSTQEADYWTFALFPQEYIDRERQTGKIEKKKNIHFFRLVGADEWRSRDNKKKTQSLVGHADDISKSNIIPAAAVTGWQGSFVLLEAHVIASS